MRWKNKKLFVVSTVLYIFLLILSVQARTYYITRETYFPSKNGSYINFDSSLLPLSFTTLYGDTQTRWHFNSYWISSTVNMEIDVFFTSNWFNYTVSGSGTQEIYVGSKPTSVFLDGISKFENDGWSYGSGTVTVTGALSSGDLYWGSPPPPPPSPSLPNWSPPSSLQFLAEGDLLGFLRSLYVAAFQSIDILLGTLAMIVTMGLYIRTRSIPLLSIMWLLIGTALITAMPFVAGLGVFFIIIGIACMLFGLVAKRGATT